MTSQPAHNNAPDFWERIYRSGKLSWDLGGPTPVLSRLLGEGRFARGAVFVPGAGHGYDAREWARHGFAVTAADFAAEAAQWMRDLAEPAAPVTIMQADLFALPPSLDGAFDYVYDSMCFCAIDPLQRPAFADIVARLLKPGGAYVALAFPVGNFQGGPPHAIHADAFVFMCKQRGLALESREQPPDSVPHKRGCEELFVFRKTK